MKKSIICAAALSLVIGFSFTGNVFAADEKGPAEIVIEPTAAKPKKSPVTFPHAKHQETLKCADCHHSMDDAGKQVAWVEGQKNEKCSSCHNAEKLAGKKKGKLKLDTLKGAAHGNCLACHKAKAKEDAKLKNLKKCTTCHPKKKK
ncbi:MAG: cytochrome c3 family protein [Thermodesulfobacteriota bacterium]